MCGILVLKYSSFDLSILFKIKVQKNKSIFSLYSEKFKNRKLIPNFLIFLCSLLFYVFMESHSDLYIPVVWQLISFFLRLTSSFLQCLHLFIHQTFEVLYMLGTMQRTRATTCGPEKHSLWLYGA